MSEPPVDGVVGADGTIHPTGDELAAIGVGPGDNVRVLPGPLQVPPPAEMSPPIRSVGIGGSSRSGPPTRRSSQTSPW